jgi:DNA-binding NarL/FixJ family response regulator
MQPSPESSGPLPHPVVLRTIRVLVVDDHPMVREVIARACADRSGIVVVGEAGNGHEAVEKCRELGPDVLILDLGLPGLSGFEVIHLINEAGLAPSILVVSARDDQAAIFECIRLGVHGYLVKTGPVEDIADAVEAVAFGARVFSLEQQRAAHAALRDLARRSRDSARAAAHVTPRELTVLRLLADGSTNRQIASMLGVSERTVSTHLAQVYRKLDVGNRLQATNRARELQLLGPRT